MKIIEREKHRRYAKGTLVVATANFRAENFKVRINLSIFLLSLLL